MADKQLSHIFNISNRHFYSSLGYKKLIQLNTMVYLFIINYIKTSSLCT